MALALLMADGMFFALLLGPVFPGLCAEPFAQYTST